MRDFALFLSQLLPACHGLDYYCDFGKVERRVDEARLSLCMLNSLVGADDLRRAVETL